MTAQTGFSVIAAEFNKDLIEGMIQAAREEMQASNLPLLRVLRVPGCYEIPIVADAEARLANVRGLIVLGYIERGETLHGEVMGHVVNRALVELQMRVQKPIGLGIIGPGATVEQARVRQVGVAKGAVHAVKRVAELLGPQGQRVASGDTNA